MEALPALVDFVAPRTRGSNLANVARSSANRGVRASLPHML